jgi:hypothetical protein
VGPQLLFSVARASSQPPLHARAQCYGAYIFDQIYGLVAKIRDGPADRIQFFSCCVLFLNIGRSVANVVAETSKVGAQGPIRGWILGTGHQVGLHTSTGFLRRVAEVFVHLTYVMLSKPTPGQKAAVIKKVWATSSRASCGAAAGGPHGRAVTAGSAAVPGRHPWGCERADGAG